MPLFKSICENYIPFQFLVICYFGQRNVIPHVGHSNPFPDYKMNNAKVLHGLLNIRSIDRITLICKRSTAILYKVYT